MSALSPDFCAFFPISGSLWHFSYSIIPECSFFFFLFSIRHISLPSSPSSSPSPPITHLDSFLYGGSHSEIKFPHSPRKWVRPPRTHPIVRLLHTPNHPAPYFFARRSSHASHYSRRKRPLKNSDWSRIEAASKQTQKTGADGNDGNIKLEQHIARLLFLAMCVS